MAEVIRAFGAGDDRLCVPHLELLAPEQRIVEEAVAEDLDFTLSIGMNIRPGSSVVAMDDGRLVYFPFGLVDSLTNAETI
jgi:hypothetical protein